MEEDPRWWTISRRGSAIIEGRDCQRAEQDGELTGEDFL